MPITTESMSRHVISASSRARSAASRSSPARDTSSRTLVWWVCPTPTTAQRSLEPAAITPSLEQADEVLLEARTRGGVAQRAVLAVLVDLPEGLADPDEPGDHDRVGGQRARRTG